MENKTPIEITACSSENSKTSSSSQENKLIEESPQKDVNNTIDMQKNSMLDKTPKIYQEPLQTQQPESQEINVSSSYEPVDEIAESPTMESPNRESQGSTKYPEEISSSEESQTKNSDLLDKSQGRETQSNSPEIFASKVASKKPNNEKSNEVLEEVISLDESHSSGDTENTNSKKKSTELKDMQDKPSVEIIEESENSSEKQQSPTEIPDTQDFIIDCSNMDDDLHTQAWGDSKLVPTSEMFEYFDDEDKSHSTSPEIELSDDQEEIIPEIVEATQSPPNEKDIAPKDENDGKKAEERIPATPEEEQDLVITPVSKKPQEIRTDNAQSRDTEEQNKSDQDKSQQSSSESGDDMSYLEIVTTKPKRHHLQESRGTKTQIKRKQQNKSSKAIEKQVKHTRKSTTRKTFGQQKKIEKPAEREVNIKEKITSKYFETKAQSKKPEKSSKAEKENTSSKKIDNERIQSRSTEKSIKSNSSSERKRKSTSKNHGPKQKKKKLDLCITISDNEDSSEQTHQKRSKKQSKKQKKAHVEEVLKQYQKADYESWLRYL